MILKAILTALILTTASYSYAQVAPSIPDHWEVSATVPGLLFPLVGNTPVALLAGAGLQYTYEFGKYVVMLPGASTAVPLLGVGAFTLGSLNNIPSAANVSFMVGPEILLAESVSLGCALNMVSGGTNGLQTLFESFTAKNITPVIFYSIPIGAL